MKSHPSHPSQGHLQGIPSPMSSLALDNSRDPGAARAALNPNFLVGKQEWLMAGNNPCSRLPTWAPDSWVTVSPAPHTELSHQQGHSQSCPRTVTGQSTQDRSQCCRERCSLAGGAGTPRAQKTGSKAMKEPPRYKHVLIPCSVGPS